MKISNIDTYYSWKDCNRSNEHFSNIHDDLFDQLRLVDAILTAHRIEHSIFFGTLIGALRNRDMNLHEIDNDFVVTLNFKITIPLL